MVFQVHIYCHVIQVLFGTASVLLANSTKCPRDGGGGGMFWEENKVLPEIWRFCWESETQECFWEISHSSGT